MIKSNEFIWKTAAVIRETADAVTIIFDTQGQLFSFLPGQFMNLTLVIDGARVSRSYSFSSAPGVDEHPAITVKRVPGGVVSNYIIQHAEEIPVWQVDAPHGSFYLVEGDSKKHLVLVAGGSGITPLYSILKYFLKKERGDVTLFYSSRKKEHTIFFKAIMQLSEQYPDRLQVNLFFTSDEELDPGEIAGQNYFGRITSLRLKKILKQVWKRGEETHFYLCGTASLLHLSERAIESLGISSAFVHKEYYSMPSERNVQVRLPDSMQEVWLRHQESISLLKIQPGRTVLETALEERIDVAYSCKVGTCGKCAAKVLRGKIHMKNNFALDESLLNEGYVLLCQSYPLTNDVKIQVG